MNVTYLAHHGVKGMKWGVRRYQNKDGSLTNKGRKHYGYGEDANKSTKKPSKNKPSISYKETDHDFGSEKIREEEATIVSKGTKASKKSLDKFMGASKNQYGYIDGDYDKMNEFADQIAVETSSVYRKKGRQAAIDYLVKSMGDYAYEATVYGGKQTHELAENGKDWIESKDGYDYFGVKLNMIGAKYGYKTSASEDYSDDQYFYKVKK